MSVCRDPARQIAPSSSSSSSVLSDPAHSRAPQKKRKGEKRKKEGGVGGSPPTLKLFSPSGSDDTTKSFPHRDASEPSNELTSFAKGKEENTVHAQRGTKIVLRQLRSSIMCPPFHLPRLSINKASRERRPPRFVRHMDEPGFCHSGKNLVSATGGKTLLRSREMSDRGGNPGSSGTSR